MELDLVEEVKEENLESPKQNKSVLNKTQEKYNINNKNNENDSDNDNKSFLQNESNINKPSSFLKENNKKTNENSKKKENLPQNEKKERSPSPQDKMKISHGYFHILSFINIFFCFSC